MIYERNMKLWEILRLVVGIALAVFSFLVIFQSCAAGIYDAIADNGEASGAFGILTAAFMLIAGMTGIAARKTKSSVAPVICTFLLWGGFFFSRIGAGSYGDLRIWGFLCFFAGALYLVSAARNLRGLIVTAGISLLVFILGII